MRNDKRVSSIDKLGKNKNYIVVNIDKKLYLKLREKSNVIDTSIRNLVHVILEDQFKNDEFLRLVAPRLSLIQFNEDSILIKDEKMKKSRLAEITIINGRLWCDLDEKGDCEHIHYCLRLPRMSEFKDKLKQL